MKLLLIDDHPIVRAGCVRVLKQREGLEIVEADTAQAGLDAARASAPDVIVLDLNLPDRRGLDVLSDLKSVCARAAVVVFSMYEDAAFVTAAMNGGALGYVTKNDDPDALLEAVEAVARGDIYLSSVIEQRLARSGAEPDPAAGLSDRERRLLELLADGRTLGEASGVLGVSYRTTAEEAARLRNRLGLRTNAALIKFAVERTAR